MSTMSTDTSAASTDSEATTTGTGLTERVARWCADVDGNQLPADVVTVVQHAVLDWLGVTIAGATEPLTGILAEELAFEGGSCTLITRDQRARPVDAAFINGAAAHALDDDDDTHMAMPGHPSTPVLAGLLAIAEDAGLDGRCFVRAAVCGLEMSLRLSWLAQPNHDEAGWHATSTLGTIGSAIACPEAIAADDVTRRRAIGLAVSQAAGLKSMFGTMTKPTQVGKAAANGALAARLAAAGLTSSQQALEDPQGFLEVYAGGAPLTDSFDAERFELLDVLFKYHAACYFTHAGIDAAASLRRDGFQDREPDRVELQVHPANLTVCDIRVPETGLEAKFSLTTTSAMGLLGRDTADPTSYDRVVEDAAVRDLAARVAIQPADGLARTEIRIQAWDTDGRSHTATADSGRPDRDLKHQQTRLEAKFVRLAEPALGEDRTSKTIDIIRHLQELSDLRELTGLVAARS